MATMQTLVWTAPRQMELRPAPVPVPGPGQVLLKVAVAGICGSELSGYLGHNSLRRPPLVMGHEFSGTVAELGEGVEGLAPGQLVTVNPLIACGQCPLCRRGLEHLCPRRWLVGVHAPGAFAQYVLVPASACVPVPAGMDEHTAALAEPLACAVRAWEVAGTGVQDPVLILGAGPIGLMALAVARAAGAAPIVVADVNPARLEVARRWGAHRVVNPRDQDPVAAVRELTDGLGAEAALDCVGAGATREAAVRAVRPGGRAVFVGLHEASFTFTANDLVRSEVQICGSFCYTRRSFARAVALLAAGAVRPDPSWFEERPLAAGPEAFADLIDRPSQVAKVVLRP